MSYFKVNSQKGHPDGIHPALDQKLKSSLENNKAVNMLSIRGQEYPLELQALYSYNNRHPQASEEDRALFVKALKKSYPNASFSSDKIASLPAVTSFHSAPKPTAVHQKTSQGPLLKGSIALEGVMTRRVDGDYGFDPTDHTYGSFPEGSEKCLDESKIKGLFDLSTSINTESNINQKVDRKIEEVRRKNGQLFISVSHHCPKEIKSANENSTTFRGRTYDFSNAGKKQFRYYGQRMMDLKTVQKYVELGILSIKSFDQNAGKCEINQKDFPDLPETFTLDLNNKQKGEIDTNDSLSLHSALDYYIQDEQKKIQNPATEAFLSFANENNQFKFPLNYLKNKETIPVMEQVGDNGLPIRGDLDTMHTAYDKEAFSSQEEFLSLSNNINTYALKDKELLTHIISLENLLNAEFEKEFGENVSTRQSGLFTKMGITNQNQAKNFKNFFMNQMQALSGFGAGSTIDMLNTLVMNFNVHENNNKASSFYFQHGAESYNPGHCEDFGPCALYLREVNEQGKTEINCYHTANQYDYIELILDKNLEESVMRVSPAHMGYSKGKDTQQYDTFNGTVDEKTSVLWATMALLQSKSPESFQKNTDKSQQEALEAIYNKINNKDEKNRSKEEGSFCSCYSYLAQKQSNDLNPPSEFKHLKAHAKTLLVEAKNSNTKKNSLVHLMKKITFEMQNSPGNSLSAPIMPKPPGSQKSVELPIAQFEKRSSPLPTKIDTPPASPTRRPSSPSSKPK